VQGELIQDLILSSTALGRTMQITVILPPQYNPGRATYPVLFFLHPWGLSPQYLTNKLRIHEHLWQGITNGTLPPMVIAMPSGERSFFLNAADPPGHDWHSYVDSQSRFFDNALDQYGRYGDYLLQEVIPFVEANFHVRKDRDGQAIGGISMGGAAAAVHAFRDPKRFCAVGIHSPALFSWTPAGGGPPWIFGLDQASFAERNPADLARRVSPATQPRIFLDTGDSDPMRHEVQKLHDALAKAGLRHEFAINQGGHNKLYWEPRMKHYLAFYARDWRFSR